MISDSDILDLLRLPKVIEGKAPASGFRETDRDIRCDVTMSAISDESIRFQVFIRRHNRYIENFSIGLRYQTSDIAPRSITLVRYNGAHGEYSLATDGHFARPHIHYITADEIAAGYAQPREKKREITNRYHTFEEALIMFFQDTATTNRHAYFPNLGQTRLFNGHR